ncbi:MAG TPA: hypothetical protein VFP21_05580 [Solirubrobacterales bacterium]|nr:hypothetical protein [Solirubrobacterales bacterium]
MDGKTPAEPPSGKPKEKDEEYTPAEETFVRGLIERGEAAKAVNGKLPPGATHEIVEERPGRLPKIARRRFSSY